VPEIVLASTSPWRRKLLTDAGLVVRARSPGVDERAVTADGPVALALELARRKADAVAALEPGAWVIGADQVVHQAGEVFGKPLDADDHAARLRSMRGRAHELVTGWALRGPGGPVEGVATTRLVVRADVTDAEIDAYVASGEGSGCAGGYAVESRGVFLFEAIDGDWFNVIGLPLLDVLGALRARGWRFGG
jgi:septum formation protein